MKFTTRDGIDLDYQIDGKGHPILCLPGLTRNASDFDEFTHAYADKAQIIRLTFRGREPSQFDPNWENYNVFREGADAIELLDFLEIESAFWLGTSRGGLVTMALAPKEISRMKAVVLNDIGPELKMEGLGRIVGYLGIAPEFVTLDEAALSLEAVMREQFPTLGKDDWRALAGRWYKFEGGKAHLRYDAKLRDAVLAGGVDLDLWAGFDALRACPMGMIWGKNSDLMGENEVLKMQEHNPDMKLAAIDDRGHVPFLNEPESLALIDEIFEMAFGAS